MKKMKRSKQSKFVRETLEQNKNSIELALVNFLSTEANVSEKPEDNFMKKLGSEIASALPFSDYLELSYALDEYDQDKPQDEQSVKAAKRIKDIINRHKDGVETAISDAIKQNSSMATHKDFINKILGFDISEAKSKDRENLEIARQAKPRWDPKQTPKAGTFDKDTKKIIKRKDPMDRKTIKHKGKVYESVEEFLKENVMGMAQVPALSQLRSLAGLGDAASGESCSTSELQYSDPSPVEGQTEAYAQAMDYLALIQELMPHMTVQEFKDFLNSVRIMVDELEID